LNLFLWSHEHFSFELLKILVKDHSLVRWSTSSFEVFDGFFQVVDGFMLKFLCFMRNSSQMSFFLSIKLLFSSLFSFLTLSKDDEKKRKYRYIEECILSMFTILVHSITHYTKVNNKLLQKYIILVVTMWVHYKFDQFNKLVLLFFRHTFKQSREVNIGKFL